MGQRNVQLRPLTYCNETHPGTRQSSPFLSSKHWYAVSQRYQPRARTCLFHEKLFIALRENVLCERLLLVLWESPVGKNSSFVLRKTFFYYFVRSDCLFCMMTAIAICLFVIGLLFCSLASTFRQVEKSRDLYRYLESKHLEHWHTCSYRHGDVAVVEYS